MTKDEKIAFLKREIELLVQEIPYVGKSPRYYKKLCKKRDKLSHKLETLLAKPEEKKA